MVQRAWHEVYTRGGKPPLADCIVPSAWSGPGSELAACDYVGQGMDPKSSMVSTGSRSNRTPSKSYTRRTSADAAGRTVSPKPKTILVVEDAKDTRDFFIVALSDAGYRVLSASSVRQALRLLRVEKSVDAIVADYNLGDGSGSALIHQARNEGLLDETGTPTLICTAYRYVELPPNVAIIHKPIAEADLLRKIACALEGTVE